MATRIEVDVPEEVARAARDAARRHRRNLDDVVIEALKAFVEAHRSTPVRAPTRPAKAQRSVPSSAKATSRNVASNVTTAPIPRKSGIKSAPKRGLPDSTEIGDKLTCSNPECGQRMALMGNPADELTCAKCGGTSWLEPPGPFVKGLKAEAYLDVKKSDPKFERWAQMPSSGGSRKRGPFGQRRGRS